jgi:hypothetical protein
MNAPQTPPILVKTTKVTVRERSIELAGVHWIIFQVGKKRYVTNRQFNPGDQVEAWPEKLRETNNYRLVPDFCKTCLN